MLRVYYVKLTQTTDTRRMVLLLLRCAARHPWAIRGMSISMPLRRRYPLLLFLFSREWRQARGKKVNGKAVRLLLLANAELGEQREMNSMEHREPREGMDGYDKVHIELSRTRLK